MLFKIISLSAALAMLTTGSAVAALQARQEFELATCAIVTTPSNTPNREGALLDEFIVVLNVAFANDLPPGNAIVTGSTSFSDNGDSFTVTKTTGGSDISAEETRNIIRAWTGRSFPGAGQFGVDVDSWRIDSVSC